MNAEELQQLKFRVRMRLHALTNCQQAVLGFFELGEYRKAHVMCLECRTEYSALAATMADIDNENDKTER